jgi:hypothetical protein
VSPETDENLGALIERWASGRRLTYASQGEVPLVTPGIFRNGTTGPVIEGELPGGGPGTIALQRHSSSKYGAAHQTICLTEIPESIAFLPELWCRDAGYRHTRGYTLGTQGFEKDWTNFEFESIKVNRKFAIQAPPEMDENWMRQLFSPTFIDLLAERTPKDFWFELIEGQLCTYLPGPAKGADQLDNLWELTSEIAERIRRECLEEESVGRRDAAVETPASRHDAEMAAKLDWPDPPADVVTAQRAYLPLAREEGGTTAPALKLGTGAAVVILLVTVPIPPLILWLVLGAAGLVIGILFDLLYVAIALGAAGLLFRMTRRSQIDKRAAAYAKIALVESYARSRDLEVLDPRILHSEFMRIDFPGPARFAMRGQLPGTKRDGYLALCHDPAGGAGYEVAMLPTEAREVESNDGFTAEVQRGQLLVYAATDRATGASTAGLDAVSRRAAHLA